MIIRFTPEQIAYLNCLKDTGRYQKHGKKRIYEDVLFNVLAEGCRFKNIHFFRSKHFQMDYPCNRSDTDRRGRGSHSDMSGLLSHGEILTAIRYGNNNGLIEKVSHSRWMFVGNDSVIS